jgi:hypothetical protein
MNYVFMGSYDWPPFLIGPLASVIGVLIAAAIEQGLLRPLLKERYTLSSTSAPLRDLDETLTLSRQGKEEVQMASRAERKAAVDRGPRKAAVDRAERGYEVQVSAR